MAEVERALWGSDVPVSVPILSKSGPGTLRVPMQGLGFEPQGLVFDLDEAGWEAVYLPAFAPEDPL